MTHHAAHRARPAYLSAAQRLTGAALVLAWLTSLAAVVAVAYAA